MDHWRRGRNALLRAVRAGSRSGSPAPAPSFIAIPLQPGSMIRVDPGHLILAKAVLERKQSPLIGDVGRTQQGLLILVHGQSGYFRVNRLHVESVQPHEPEQPGDRSEEHTSELQSLMR